MSSRVSWQEFFMRLATCYAQQSTCPRAQVGCVIVNNNRQIGAGFNGAVSGDEHCTEVEDCAVDGHCLRSIHAEVNAILQALEYAPHKVRGSTAYITHFPCINCFKVLVQAGVSRIVYDNFYGRRKNLIQVEDMRKRLKSKVEIVSAHAEERKNKC